MASQNYTNALIHAQSPYLLQHAHNPVNWVEWSLEALNTAHQENKLLLISIGYAACHWCHVMERESFEDPLVAKIMNHHFVCIKIDREERPDLDMVYMQALQLLSGKGGWPLNIVALPNGNAIWGGTYFPKNNWLNALKQLIDLHTQKPEKILQYASHLKEGMVEIENSKDFAASPISPKDIPNLLDKVYTELDPEWGGKIGAPKFMMPSLLRLCNHRTQQLQKHLHLSLEKMALGGLFDVVKGGFARYSVDHRWHVPHFEKMAYDNGLLLEIYSLALLESQNTLYLEVIDKTICFLQSDLKSPQGGFYASLDADSTNEQEELQEGAFYTWTKKQIKALIPKEEYSLFKAYYGINHHGAWEKDTYVLFRVYSPHEFSKQHKLSYTEFVQTVNRWETTLNNAREKRPKPRLDDKQICSWNALIASGLLAAYRTTQKTTYLIEAQECLMFVQNHFHSTAGLLYRLHKNKTNRVNGFLEDYAATIKCWIDAYETLFLEQYLELAKDLLTYCLAHFTSPDSPLFYFSKEDQLILRSRETNDNVIPSSNAVMAENLFRLGTHLDQPEWISHARLMIESQGEEIKKYPNAYTYWFRLAIDTQQAEEIVITGSKAKIWARDLQRSYSKSLWAVSQEPSNLPLFKNRFSTNKTQIYHCVNKQCQLPFSSLNAFRKYLNLD